MSKNIFFVGLILVASGVVSPPLALLGAFHVESERLAKFLLQASVVALGFGMNLKDVARAGRSGFAYTAVSIVVSMLLGLGLAYLIRVARKPAFLRYSHLWG
jgi:Conserved hypothetical protein 698